MLGLHGSYPGSSECSCPISTSTADSCPLSSACSLSLHLSNFYWRSGPLIPFPARRLSQNLRSPTPQKMRMWCTHSDGSQEPHPATWGKRCPSVNAKDGSRPVPCLPKCVRPSAQRAKQPLLLSLLPAAACPVPTPFHSCHHSPVNPVVQQHLSAPSVSIQQQSFCHKNISFVLLPCTSS